MDSNPIICKEKLTSNPNKKVGGIYRETESTLNHHQQNRNKSPLSIWITCCQFFFTNCRITIHYFLPFCPIDEQDSDPFSHSNISHEQHEDVS